MKYKIIIVKYTHILACFLISSADGEKKAFFWYFANLSHLPWLSFKSFSLISGTWFYYYFFL